MSYWPAVDKNRPTSEHNLVEWARPYLMSKRRIFRVLDPVWADSTPSPRPRRQRHWCFSASQRTRGTGRAWSRSSWRWSSSTTPRREGTSLARSCRGSRAAAGA
ncbi:hypothetical protein ZWY2020_054468 [Hordeum vulgare]|nr:hypothetical protein ZWY2020_054468 [Hordeum vulgare]